VKSPAALRNIADPHTRAEESAKTVREARAKADDARSRRDMAGLVLIEPYEAAQRPYKRIKDRVEAELEAGTIDYPEANRRLSKAKAERNQRMREVELGPVDVYRDILQVSRGLFVRMTQRAPEQLPHIDNPREVIEKARREITKYDRIATEALAIRDEAIDELLNRGYRGKPVRNADIARLIGVTTARAAQIRWGT
jgi:hypothetical protein